MATVKQDNLEMEELLKRFKKRDLAQTYFFKMSCRVFGTPTSRDRVIIAPRMHVVSNAQRCPVVDLPTPNIRKASHTVTMSVNSVPPVQRFTNFPAEKTIPDQDWVRERKAFRHMLNGIGNLSQWTNNKPIVTELELKLAERERRPNRGYPPVGSNLPLSSAPKVG